MSIEALIDSFLLNGNICNGKKMDTGDPSQRQYICDLLITAHAHIKNAMEDAVLVVQKINKESPADYKLRLFIQTCSRERKAGSYFIESYIKVSWISTINLNTFLRSYYLKKDGTKTRVTKQYYCNPFEIGSDHYDIVNEVLSKHSSELLTQYRIVNAAIAELNERASLLRGIYKTYQLLGSNSNQGYRDGVSKNESIAAKKLMGELLINANADIRRFDEREKTTKRVKFVKKKLTPAAPSHSMAL